MKTTVYLLAASVAVFVLDIRSAAALPAFKKAFEERYVQKGTPSFQELAKKENCNVCHVKGKEKTERNKYGEELDKLIEGRAKKRLDDAKADGGDDKQKAETAKLIDELKKAFDKVEEMKSSSGETYGEKLKSGKLPE